MTGPLVLACALATVEASAQRPMEPAAEFARMRTAFETAPFLDRTRLVNDAARVGGVEVVRWLAEIAEADPVVGAHAAVALGTVRDRTAAGELERLVLSSRPVIVRANAMRSLSAIDAAGNEALFSSLLAGVEEPLRLRQEAALALGRSKRPASAIPILVRHLDEMSSQPAEGGEQLRISIIQALEGSRDERVRAALKRHASRQITVAERAFTLRALQDR